MTMLAPILSYRDSSLLASFISLVSILIILGSSVYSHFWLKNPYAKFFALAWGSLLMGIFIIHFRNMGLLSVNTFTSYSPLIGAFIELTLLSIALAYRYNIQKQQMIQKDHMLYKQSRFANMGEMIANIAHQWRQPINRVNLSLEVIEDILKEKNICNKSGKVMLYENKMIDKKIKNSKKNIQYMSQTIDDFSNFFHPNKIKNRFKIDNIIKRSLKLIESRLETVTIHKFLDNKIELYGFENEFVQVLLVLLNNSVDNFEIMDKKQRDIYIETKIDNDNIILNVSDNGGGILDENIDKIFDPYFTTKFKSQGTGLGLYMAKMLIEDSMNGILEVVSDNIGATFQIILKNEEK
jgi:signal transduction histidine kinase